MAVKEGYKQTEVGVIPEDWDVRELSSVTDVRDGTHESPKYQSSGIKFVTSKNIVNGKLDLSDITFISEDDAEQINKRSKVDIDDILMAMIGTIGDAVLIDKSPEFCIKNVALIKPYKDKVCPKYLYQLIVSSGYQNFIHSKLAGGIQKFISLSILRSLCAIIPPFPEQKAIATALSDIDGLINSLSRLIEKKKSIKQGAMQELLTGKKRLEGFSGEWKKAQLGDVLQVCHGKSQIDVIDAQGKFPILATGGVIGRTNAYLYDRPSVLIGRKGTINVPQYIDKPFWTIDTLFYTKLEEKADSKYVFYLFHVIDWLQHNEASGVPSLSAKTIEAIEISIPALSEQTAIATILSDMDSEIEKLQVKLDKYKAIKQGMMQELLTGRIRLLEGA